MTSKPKTVRARRKTRDIEALAPKIEQAESLLKAVANAHRLIILCKLHKGEACVSELKDAVGLSQSSLSQHLARLREDTLVKTRRDSQSIYYSLADDRSKKLIKLVYDMFCGGPDA